MVGGDATALSPLLGLRSMNEKDAVMETGRNHRRPSFSGPGDHQIDWTLGTVHFPMESAPSEHYSRPCHVFPQPRRSPGGSARTTTTLHATTVETTPEMGTEVEDTNSLTTFAASPSPVPPAEPNRTSVANSVTASVRTAPPYHPCSQMVLQSTAPRPRSQSVSASPPVEAESVQLSQPALVRVAGSDSRSTSQ